MDWKALPFLGNLYRTPPQTLERAAQRSADHAVAKYTECMAAKGVPGRTIDFDVPTTLAGTFARALSDEDATSRGLNVVESMKPAPKPGQPSATALTPPENQSDPQAEVALHFECSKNIDIGGSDSDGVYEASDTYNSEVLGDPAIAAALRRWGTCMEAAGFATTSVRSLADDMRRDLATKLNEAASSADQQAVRDQAFARERDAARAQVACDRTELEPVMATWGSRERRWEDDHHDLVKSLDLTRRIYVLMAFNL